MNVSLLGSLHLRQTVKHDVVKRSRGNNFLHKEAFAAVIGGSAQFIGSFFATEKKK